MDPYASTDSAGSDTTLPQTPVSAPPADTTPRTAAGTVVDNVYRPAVKSATAPQAGTRPAAPRSATWNLLGSQSATFNSTSVRGQAHTVPGPSVDVRRHLFQPTPAGPPLSGTTASAGTTDFLSKFNTPGSFTGGSYFDYNSGTGMSGRTQGAATVTTTTASAPVMTSTSFQFGPPSGSLPGYMPPSGGVSGGAPVGNVPSANLQNAPGASNNAPGAFQNAPGASNSAPGVFQSAPVAYNTAPVAFQSAPVASNGAPVAFNSTPATVNGAPVAFNSAPVPFNSAPATVNTAPAAFNMAPAAWQQTGTYYQPPAAAVHSAMPTPGTVYTPMLPSHVHNSGPATFPTSGHVPHSTAHYFGVPPVGSTPAGAAGGVMGVK